MSVIESILKDLQGLPTPKLVEVARYVHGLSEEAEAERRAILRETHGGLDEGDGKAFEACAEGLTSRGVTMAQGILLDSSVVILHLRAQLDIAALVPPAEPLFLPLTALGELLKGVLKSNQPDRNRLLLESFLRTVAVLHPDATTAQHYAQVSVELEKKGAPIPENDIWIAAMALECAMPLAARDAHFAKVSGLQVLAC